MFGNILISLLVILLVALFSAGILYWLVIRPWLLRWGATDADVHRFLPGDDLVSHPIHRMLGVAGSVDDDHCSATRIIPELQHLEVGDSVEIGPEMGYAVVAIEAERALVLHSTVNMSTWQSFDLTDPMPDKYLDSSWVWLLDEVDERTTRLIVRTRQASSFLTPPLSLL
jgi:hypothetical protein